MDKYVIFPLYFRLLEHITDFSYYHYTCIGIIINYTDYTKIEEYHNMYIHYIIIYSNSKK